MKRKTEKRRSFAVTRYFILWVELFVVALIFSQTMPNSISAVFLIVISAMPVIELIYVLIGKATVKAYFYCDTERAEKKSVVKSSLCIQNGSVLPFPLTEAEFILPDGSAATCEYSECVMSILPLEKFSDDRSTVFKYRGYYSLGIKSVYIHDLLRFFKVRIIGEKTANVFIVPRRLDLGFGTEKGVAETTSARVEASGYDRTEQTDIKEYAPGDPMKSVHWKLSGKTQSLIVKKFNSETGSNTYVFVDMCARFETDKDSGNDEDINEYAVDAAVETACSYITAHLRRDENVHIIFHDSRPNLKEDDAVCRTLCDSVTAFEEFFDYFSATPISSAQPLTSLVSGIEDVSGTFVFVLAYLSDYIVDMISASTDNAGKTEVLVCEPFNKNSNSYEMKNKYRIYADTLAAAGITVRFIPPTDKD